MEIYDEINRLDKLFSEPVHANKNGKECSECGGVMMKVTDGMQCELCGKTKRMSDTVNDAATCGKNYNAINYQKLQAKNIRDLLTQNKGITGIDIHRNILTAAAKTYNEIQTLTKDETDIDGKVIKSKKYIKRGNVKNEILAALIYFECLKQGFGVKKQEIASFMRLSKSGFSNGESEVLRLHSEGRISISLESEIISSFARKYLEKMGLIDVPNYYDFVVKIVDRSIRYRVGTSNTVNSKVIGTISLLVEKEGLDITHQQIETTCDETRKNTFLKFHKEIDRNIMRFIDIFDELGIKHGIKGLRKIPIEYAGLVIQ
jgi:hypothetical protein